MERELCEVCTGSYTGEFSPKWRGPWAECFDATGKLIEGIDRDDTLVGREQRRAVLGNRNPLGRIYVR